MPQIPLHRLVPSKLYPLLSFSPISSLIRRNHLLVTEFSALFLPCSILCLSLANPGHRWRCWCHQLNQVIQTRQRAGAALFRASTRTYVRKRLQGTLCARLLLLCQYFFMIYYPPRIIPPVRDPDTFRTLCPIYPEEPTTTGSASELQVYRQQFQNLLNETDPELLERYFGGNQRELASSEASNRLMTFLLRLSVPGSLRDCMEMAIEDTLPINVSGSNSSSAEHAHEQVRSFFEMEKRTSAAFRIHRNRFPTSIWHCCKRFCFTMLATDPGNFMAFDEIVLIHDFAEQCHRESEELNSSVCEARRPGIGTSTVAFVAPSRAEREALSGERSGTSRLETLRKFAKFVSEVLPFLYGQSDSPRGTKCVKRKICTQAICCILGVSRNFLYNRKSAPNPENASEDDLTSLIDTAGLRLRQHRRMGFRGKYPSLQALPEFNCGCYVPCFSSVPLWNLVGEYEDFVKLAKELKPRHKENRFLLNRLFCPLTNSTTKVCNQAISALYTVSEGLVADVRRTLDAMCQDSCPERRHLQTDGSARYKYERSHPMNRYPDEVRDKIERHLDMVLRADPAGSSGESVCRVYSPEINTQEKLRTVLRTALDVDESVDVELSASTLQRMVIDYLKRRNFSSISFSQSDHNACPNCKTLHYAVLQYHHQAALLQRECDTLSRTRPLLEVDQQRLDTVEENLRTKRFQESECIDVLQVHNSRDSRIRGFVKNLSDHFRKAEERYRETQRGHSHRREFTASAEWNLYPDRAMITHQDDMSKVDLPHFVVSASSDITRWRFDVNAHVSSVTNDAVVFSH